METRPERERTSVAGDDQGFIVLPESAPAHRVVNWAAPDPSQLEQAEAPLVAPRKKPKKTFRYRFFTFVMVLSFGLMAAALVAAVTDWGLRTFQLNALLNEIERSEEVMISAKAEVATVLGADADISGEEDAARRAQLQQIAASAAAELDAINGRIVAIDVVPWFNNISAARASYISHNEAWQSYLNAAAEDANAWFGDYPQIDLTWQLVAPHLRAAVPTPALLSLEERVSAVLSESSQEKPVQLDA